MNEADILDNAIHNLERNIPINWDWKTMNHTGRTSIDGTLDLTINDRNILMFVKVKKDV